MIPREEAPPRDSKSLRLLQETKGPSVEWPERGEEVANPGSAFDEVPAPGYPEEKVCPLAGYLGTAPVLSLLTRKTSSHHGDVCVGADENNECHDGTGIGGYPP